MRTSRGAQIHDGCGLRNASSPRVHGGKRSMRKQGMVGATDLRKDIRMSVVDRQKQRSLGSGLN